MNRGKGKNINYFMGVVVFLALIFSLRGCIVNSNRADYLFEKWVQDSAKVKVLENKLGQLSYVADVTKLTQAQMKQYAETDSIISALTGRFSKLEAIVRTSGKLYVDSIIVFRDHTDTLPCLDFERKDTIKSRYYSFDYLLTKNNMVINNLTFPDTAHTIIGVKKTGFLGLKRQYVVEQTHSNKHIQITQMNPVVMEPPKSKLIWLSGGAALGFMTGILIR